MNNDNLPKWQTTDSTYIVNDRWLKLRADTCISPEGQRIAPWYVMEFPDWITCLVIDRKDDVLLLRHYRHGVDEYVSEIVGGTIDAKDESPEATVIKELREELGYEGGEVFETGIAYANPSNQTNKMHTFLAVGGDCTAEQVKELGADFVVEKMPVKTFIATVTDPTHRTIYQSLHLTAIFFALNFIRQPNAESEALNRLRSLIYEL